MKQYICLAFIVILGLSLRAQIPDSKNHITEGDIYEFVNFIIKQDSIEGIRLLKQPDTYKCNRLFLDSDSLIKIDSTFDYWNYYEARNNLPCYVFDSLLKDSVINTTDLILLTQQTKYFKKFKWSEKKLPVTSINKRKAKRILTSNTLDRKGRVGYYTISTPLFIQNKNYVFIVITQHWAYESYERLSYLYKKTDDSWLRIYKEMIFATVAY